MNLHFWKMERAVVFLYTCHVKQQQHHKADVYHSCINWSNRRMLLQIPLQTPEGSVFLLPQIPTLIVALPFSLDAYEMLYSRFCTGFSATYLVHYTEIAKPSSTTLPGYTTSSILSAFIAYPSSPLLSLAPNFLSSPWSLWGLDWMTPILTSLNSLRLYL